MEHIYSNLKMITFLNRYNQPTFKFAASKQASKQASRISSNATMAYVNVLSDTAHTGHQEKDCLTCKMEPSSGGRQP